MRQPSVSPRTIAQRAATLLLATVLAGGVAPPLAAQEAAASIAPPVRAYLDSALSIMERNVLGGDTVDWQAFRDTVYRWAAGAEEPADAYAAIRRALRTLNPHSFLQLSAAQSAREVERRQPPATSTRASDERPVFSPFSGRRTPEGSLDEHAGKSIGRIAIPAFGRGHLTAFADSIEALVRTMHADGACGWVVDLRGNGGGNMWPMLAGIGPLLGGETVGHFQGPRGEIVSAWFYRDGAAGIDVRDGEVLEIARVSGEPYRIDGTPPVAVLFDRGTGSSGEAVAIAFIGRPNTRSFGVPSYGFTTANDGFRLPDSANMVLTVGVDADRNGVAYPTALVPDEVVPIAPGDTVPRTPPAEDPQLAAALAWLVRQPGCRELGRSTPEPGARPAALAIVEAQVRAFNRHDSAALAAGVAPDFVWLSVSGDEVGVEARGRAELERGMAAYFAEFPDVRSTIEDVVVNDRFVAVRERIRWSGPDDERSQAALAVYEVEDGLIRRVWYYPAERGA